MTQFIRKHPLEIPRIQNFIFPDNNAGDTQEDPLKTLKSLLFKPEQQEATFRHLSFFS